MSARLLIKVLVHWSRIFIAGPGLVSMSSLALMLFIIPVGYTFDFLLLVFGRAKDGEGRYITTEAYKLGHPAYIRHETASAIKGELRAREAKRRNAINGASPDG